MKDKNQLEKMRHSCSHLMAAAIQSLYPKTKFGIGPSIENGFYYDIELDHSLSDEDLPQIEERMRELAEMELKFEKTELSIDEAIKLVKKLGQPYKVDLLQELKKEGERKVTFYKLGEFVDLCKGPHLANTKEIGPFKLLSLAGAYWRGDETKPMLTRVYGTCFGNKKDLEAHLIQQEEAKRRDHRRLGVEQKLFIFDDEVGPGLPLYCPNGAMLRHLLVEYAFNTYLKRGYQPVSTPHIGQEALWEHSGHLDFYHEDMYGPMEIDERRYRLKPMNCPFHVKIYNSDLRSYRELPIRYAEMGTVYRYEKSGQLHGLTRVRGFTQDDGHIICTPDQLEAEIIEALKLTRDIYDRVGMKDLIFKLSTRDPKNMEKYLGDKKGWNMAEEALKKALLEIGEKDYEIDEGGAAFYAPKIDIDAVDSLGRRWQLSTIQVDFNLPARFEMTYIDEKGKKQIPFMIHRALLGSLDRFLGVYIEHTGGAYPLWLAPVQAIVIPITDDHQPYANKVGQALEEKGFRVKVDSRPLTTSAKVRQAVIERLPYILVVGDREKEAGTVSVRTRESEKSEVVKLDSFIKLAEEELEK